MNDATAPRRVQISPSLLSADFAALGRDVALLEPGKPDWLHLDVMDGHFVPNLTIGPPVVKALKAITEVKLDVHLMVSNPERQLGWFIDAGADLLTFHLECGGDSELDADAPGSSAAITEVTRPDLIGALLSQVSAADRLVGLAINPGTPAELLLPYLSHIDLAMVMGVHPGFGGQGFMADSLDKVRLLADAAARLQPSLLIEVDGGINAQTAVAAVAAGANMLVAGNAIFGEADPLAAMAAIVQAVGAAAEDAAAGAAAEATAPATPGWASDAESAFGPTR
jgi:ribulose-phosphate 3-epimerase